VKVSVIHDPSVKTEEHKTNRRVMTTDKGMQGAIHQHCGFTLQRKSTSIGSNVNTVQSIWKLVPGRWRQFVRTRSVECVWHRDWTVLRHRDGGARRDQHVGLHPKEE